MRHAEHELFNTGSAAALDDVVDQRNQCVATLERKSLLPDVLGVQVALKALSGRQLPENISLFLSRELLVQTTRLKLVLQPESLLGVRNVRKLGADRSAIDLRQLRNDVSQRGLRRYARCATASEEWRIQICIGKPQVGQVEHSRTLAECQAKWIELRDQMAAVRVDLDQTRNRALLRRASVDLDSARTYRDRRCARAFSERSANGSMRDVRRAGRRQTREIVTPLERERVWIRAVTFVLRLDEIGVFTEKWSGVELLFACCAHDDLIDLRLPTPPGA